MSDEATRKDVEVLVVQFLVPVYDRDGKPYRRSVRKQIRRDLEDKFDSWSLAADKPLPGAWRNPASGEVEYDDSWRYEIGITPERLDELDAYLGELAPPWTGGAVAGRLRRRRGEGHRGQAARRPLSLAGPTLVAK